MNKVIDKAIILCGSREKLATACGVSVMTVGNWLKGLGIKTKYLKPISDATKGEVSVDEILRSLSDN
ncbi:Uncharacterized protein conserved in bacteria, prophage-related [Actinobacillus ureae]|nr:YdaS family helix-turn-helix protein [Actinobacillus ureae]SUT85405.1 Uncharacterized protein conserved in bacteria, prophage-related [Actinobacillus ureae]SUU42527.1 Uncharacterized protein conserved in bacteria, prophage-related [Actinobacillus ureae]